MQKGSSGQTTNRRAGFGNPGVSKRSAAKMSVLDSDGNWPEQRDKALRRDNYACQRCGKTKEALGYLDVHHIVPVFNFPDPTKAHALTNLLCLCRQCHKAAECFSSLFFFRKDHPRETEALLAELKAVVRRRARQKSLDSAGAWCPASACQRLVWEKENSNLGAGTSDSGFFGTYRPWQLK
jgi:HNH endonuclease